VDAATRMVAAQLRLTREHAITTRQSVALLVPAKVGPPGSNYVAFNRVWSARVAANWTWQGWIPNTKWEYLPSGTVVVEADEDVAHMYPARLGRPTEYSPSLVQNVDLNGDNVADSPNSVRSVIFKPTGALTDTLNRRYITLVEGFYDGTVIRDRNRQNYRIIEVDVYTGRVTHRPR